MYYSLFSHCTLVKGHTRSAIYDLQREELYFITNSLFEVFRIGIFSVEDIDKKTIDIDIFNDLLQDEPFIKFKNKEEFNNFPPLNLDYEESNHISNAIIHFSEMYSFSGLISQLENLGCQDVQIIIKNSIDINKLKEILELFNNTIVKNIQIICGYFVAEKIEMTKIIHAFLRLKLIYLYDSPFNKTIYDVDKTGNIIYTKNELPRFDNNCRVSEKYIKLSMNLYLESLQSNSYYNKKIIIDENGNYKRSLAENKLFGNINSIPIKEIIEDVEFKKFWNVKKDLIKVCKDCEFRYMCVDSRIPLKNDEKEWEFDTDCNYNPYKLKWKK
jgi:SPASM domain peptide maturase of grasp-with-spasm system